MLFLKLKFDKTPIKIVFLIFFYLCFLANFPALASNSALDELDGIRANLSILNNNSSEYAKVENKLKKFVERNKIDYSNEARYIEIERLIKECKYEAAVYEIKSLISLNYKTDKCYEYLGDIAKRTEKNPSIIAKYYKEAININPQNISAKYKLSKLYFREKRNILGIENLKTVVELTDNKALLDEIEYIILNNISPQDRFEANNLYEILGIIYEKEGKYPDTYKAYKRAIELNKTDIFLKYRLADLYIKNNKKADALNVLNSILDENKTDSQIRLSKAQILKDDGNLYEAAGEYLEILKQYPNSAYAKYQIFKIYKGKENPKNILKIINKYNFDFKGNKEDYIQFANFLSNLGDNEGASMFLEYAQTFEPKKQTQNPIVPQKNSTKTQLNKADKKQNTQKNTVEPEQSKLKDKRVIAGKETKDNVNIQMQKQQNETVKSLKTDAIKKEQISSSTKEETKKTSTQQVKPQKQSQKQVSKQPQKSVSKQTAKKTDDKKTIENKIALERKNAIKKNPKKYYEHKHALDKYLSINPKDKLTYIAIGNTYKLMGEYTNAIINYQKALKLDALDSDIYFNIALTYLENSELDNSKLYLEKADKLNHDDKKIQNMLAFVNQKIITRILNNSYEKYSAKDYVSAFQILDNGIKRFPKSAQMYYYRALVYDGMNRNAAQISDLQKAIDLDPSFYMAYYQLGHAYEKIKDERSALVAYERFLSIEPDEKELVNEVQKKVLNLGNKYY